MPHWQTWITAAIVIAAAAWLIRHFACRASGRKGPDCGGGTQTRPATDRRLKRQEIIPPEQLRSVRRDDETPGNT